MTADAYTDRRHLGQQGSAVFNVEVGGRLRAVSIGRAGDRFHVDVDGLAYLVDAARIDPSTLSLILIDRQNVTHEVGLAETAVRGELAVHMRGRVLRARLAERSSSARQAARPRWEPEGHANAGGGAVRIAAPMPGKIARLLVSPGDVVSARQGLVIVEAMKMENELRSPKDGRVTEVLVNEGMSVEAGRALVVVE